jgi:hypothetical protein
MAQDCWHAERLNDKVRVWFAPPGWRPADVAARFPKAGYDPRRDFERYDPPRSLSLSLYVLVQFSVLLSANSHFLSALPKQAAPLSLLYFAWILASLVTLGGLMEGRRSFLIWETGRLALTAAVSLAAGSWFGGVSDRAVLLSLAAFVAVSLAWLGLQRLTDARLRIRVT